MKTSSFKVTVLVSALLVGMCLLLFPSALELYRVDYDADVGPGLVPMICLVGITGLAVYTLILDLVKRRALATAEKRELEDGELDSSFLGLALVSIMLMTLYAVVWACTHFIFGSLIFCFAMAYLCLPKEKRNTRGIAAVSFFLGLFVLLVWVSFTKLLGVNLG